MSVNIIYFVHGTTTDNEKHKATGQNQGVLSELGIKRCKELINKINIEEIDLVICSDLQRAKDSANYVFEDKKEIIYDNRLRECNYGELNGADSSLVKYEDHINVPFPKGESLTDVEKRMRDFCQYLLENHNEKTVAIVAHKATQLALEVIINNNTWEKAIENDWRKLKKWQPGWAYELKKI